MGSSLTTPADSLREALAGLCVEGLKGLARLFEDHPRGRKDELVQLVLGHLEAGGLQEAWRRLDALGQAAVAETVHGPERRLQLDRLRAKYGRVPERTADSTYHKRNAVPLDLFFYDDVMPADLKERLKAFVPPPALPTLESTESIPERIPLTETVYNHREQKSEEQVRQLTMVRRDMAEAAVHDIRALLRLAEAGRLAVGDKTGLPGASALEAIGRVLHGGDYYAQGEKEGPIRAFAWALLLQADKLASSAGGRLRLTRKGQEALSRPPAEVLKGLWESWLETDLLDELSRIDVIKGQSGRSQRGRTDPAERREAIADALAECPVGRWVEIDEFFRYLRAAGHDFVIGGDLWRLYICEPHYGALGHSGYGRWNILQARYALCVLMEYAASLGVVDVAFVGAKDARQDYGDIWGTDDLSFFSRYDGLKYFRVSPLGAFLLGLAGTYDAPRVESEAVLKALPTLAIVASGGDLLPADRLFLERIAPRTGDRVWTLDRARLLATVEEGVSLDEIEQFLRERCIDPLPAPLQDLLREVRDRAERFLDLGKGRLLECADAAMAALFASDSRTRKACRQVGERHVFVPASREAAFRRGLHGMGYHLPSGRSDAE